VRAADAECPFCGAAVTATLGPEVRVPRRGRAALFAFGAAAAGVVAVSGCGDDGTPMPLYGGPPDSAVSDSATPDGGDPDTAVAPAYGAPADTGTDAASDGGDPDTSVAPAYGAPADAG
jgi:hypothetical protein